MSNIENDLSKYIDTLNEENKPKEHQSDIDSPELEELMNTVRLVKSLKEPALPASDYPQKVARAVAGKLPRITEVKKPKRAWFVGLSTVAAAVVMIFILNLTFGKNNIVYAMEQAFQGVKAYHGVIEIIETNGEGKETAQAKREVWASKEGQYYIEELEGSQKGLITVNNGAQKWQLRPDSKQAYIFSAFPDPYRFTFELGNEVEDVKNAIDTKSIGEDIVSGRAAIILEVSPKGGAPYKLWIDKETKLPLKKQGAMQNALQYTVTYSNIEFIDTIPSALMAYELPASFEEVNVNTEQLVNNIEEAEETVGFELKMPKGLAEYIMEGITVETDKKIVKIYYSDKNKQNNVVVLQGKAAGEFKPASTAILGKVGNNIAEIQSPVAGDSGIFTGGGAYAGITNLSSIRWQEKGFEYAVVGDAAIEDMGMIIKGIVNGNVQIPSIDDKSSIKPKVEVAVDLEIEENEQKSVDAGHTPWKLDPAFVAQVFVSLQISPEGIQGEYPVQYEDFKVEQNTGSEAILEVKDDKTPISKVYLKKLIRQDNTGVWTVVGYDPAK